MLVLYSAYQLPLKDCSVTTSRWDDLFLMLLTGQAVVTPFLFSALTLGEPLLPISHLRTWNPYCDLQCRLCSLLILFPRLEEHWKVTAFWTGTICCHPPLL